jgi:pyruvate ferredoxin oxidoreductase alpha subunit
VVDTLRAGSDGAGGALRVGTVGVATFRPFPAAEVRAALSAANHVVVVEKALAPGTGGILAGDVAAALAGTGAEVHTVVAGLGGRPITERSLCDVVRTAGGGRLGPLTFLDLEHALVERELARMASTRRSGPSAENLLRDLGVVAGGAVGGRLLGNGAAGGSR